MEKKLSEMSLEELWKLFPICLTEHQPCWKAWYTDEEALLKNRVPEVARISHIGSTAIHSICAKPIVDILMEIANDYKLSDCKEAIEQSGYICMSETSDRISFNKGYTEKGFAERVFHLHLRHVGDNDELYFRDYLIEHTNIAVEQIWINPGSVRAWDIPNKQTGIGSPPAAEGRGYFKMVLAQAQYAPQKRVPAKQGIRREKRRGHSRYRLLLSLSAHQLRIVQDDPHRQHNLPFQKPLRGSAEERGSGRRR